MTYRILFNKSGSLLLQLIIHLNNLEFSANVYTSFTKFAVQDFLMHASAPTFLKDFSFPRRNIKLDQNAQAAVKNKYFIARNRKRKSLGNLLRDNLQFKKTWNGYTRNNVFVDKNNNVLICFFYFCNINVNMKMSIINPKRILHQRSIQLPWSTFLQLDRPNQHAAFHFLVQNELEHVEFPATPQLHD